MALTKNTTTVTNIQTLADIVVEQATTVKALFDKSSSDIKTYINDVLTPEVDTLFIAQTSALTTHKTSADHDGRYYTETESDAKYETITDLTNNRKLSATGNFTGTWDGLVPTASDPGLAATVNAHLAATAKVYVNVLAPPLATMVAAVGDFNPDTLTGTDDTVAIAGCISYIETIGAGALIFPQTGLDYRCDGVLISGDNITIDLNENTIHKRSGSGYIFNFGSSLTQKNIKVINGTLKGDNTVLANGGIALATDHTISNIDGVVLENITCENFAQYGIFQGSVSNFYHNNIKILNHGTIAVGGTIGIGYVIYPKNAQQDGFVNNVYSKVNLDSTLTSAAIKMQVVSKLQASNIHGVNGTESCISISATDASQYKNIIFESTGVIAYTGMAVSSNDSNVTPVITDAAYTINGVTAIGNFSSEISMNAAGVKNVKLLNVDLMTSTTNGKRIVIATNGTIDNCKFNNIKAAIRLDTFTGTSTINCEFEDITTDQGGSFTLTGNDNLINNVKTIAGGVIRATGNDNILTNCTSIDCTANAFQLAGDNNLLDNSRAINPVGRNLWVQSGAGNRYRNFFHLGGTGILNNGTGTIGLNKGTTGLRPTLTATDIAYFYLDTTLDADGKPIWWNGTAWVDATGATV
jgi:hypothetical protein